MHNRLFALLLLTIPCCPLLQAQPPTRHVILISIDGLRPEMYQDSSWPSPTLRLLMHRGTYAHYLKSVFPAYTYPSHTAMVTGALPARSGIVFNQPKNSHGEWNWFADSIRVPTLWSACRKAGLLTAAVQWPCSVNAPIDHNFPEIWDNRRPDDRITTARRYATPGLVAEVEQYATGRLDSINFADEGFGLDENSGRIAAYIFQTYKPALLAVHFAAVDGYEHEQGRDGDSVHLALETADCAIGNILAAVQHSGLQDSTTLLIVGDHGFADIHQVFRPNALIRDLPARFIPAGGSAFLYINYGGIDPRNIHDSAAHIARIVHERLDQLPPDKRSLFRIIDRLELDRMGADSAAVLALAATPGLVFSGATTAAASTNNGPGTIIQQSGFDGLFGPVNGGHHGYDPGEPQMHTGFIAAGAGVRPGGLIESLSEPDIAVLIARLLGLDFPTPDGKPVGGIIKELK